MTFRNIRFLLIQVLFVLSGNWLLAQDSTITLNQSISGVKLYEATKTITLSPGFLYTASSSTQLVAKIVPTIANSSYVFTEALENTYLDTTYQVGTIDGSASVGPTGAANYTIPIDLPPGRAGIKPQLALVYNSKAGEGLMGLGWGLAGLSSITRVPTNLYNENSIDGVDFDSNDEFALDGQRLISTGTYLRTEIESFSRITPYGTDTINPTYFKVETKDGIELFYGNTSDSRVEAQGRTVEVLEWKLNKVIDKYNNYYTISYIEINNSGEIYPSSINYTSYQSTPGDYMINFGYKTRTIPLLTYINGYQVKINKQLDTITIKSSGTVAGKYEMKYTNYKLTEVIKYGKNNSRYNSTYIGWGTGHPIINLNEIEKDELPVFNNIEGDFNGDGRSDLVIVRDLGTENLYLSDSTGTLIYQGNFTIDSAGVYPGDYNGDGLDDLLAIHYDAATLRDQYLLYISNGNSFTLYNNLPSFIHSNEYYAGDFNGNGKSDILFRGTGSPNCIIYEFDFPSAGVFDTTIIGQTNISWTNIKSRVLDMNGNGKMDLMVIDAGLSRFYELQYNCNYMSQICSNSYPTSNFNNVLLGDFNGDGMTDIFSHHYFSDYWKVSISKGNGFDNQTNTVFEDFLNSDTANMFIASDMNGDEKSDIVVIGHGINISDSIKVYIALSDGQDFNLMDFQLGYSNLSIADTVNFNFRDFTGDGVIDIFYNDADSAWLFNIQNGKPKNFVTSIRNGFGLSTIFHYASLSNNSFYSKGTAATYPVMSYQGPMYAVDTLSIEKAPNIYSSTNYSYLGAHLHLKGKGFLGFEKITSTNTSTNIQSVDEYGYNSTYLNSFPIKTKINVLSDSLIILPVSEVNYTNAVISLGGKRIFPYLDGSSQINYLTGVTVTKDFIFDNNGNLTYQEEVFDDGSYNNTTYSSFSSAGSPYPSKPQTVVSALKHFHDTQEFSLTTKYAYKSGSGKIDTITVGQVKTNYTYDATYGNLIKVRVSDGSTSRRDSFVYESKNMFIWKSYNALNHITERTFDYATGNVLTEKAPISSIQRNNSYDDFGKLYNSYIYALGTSQTISYGWTTGSRPSGSVYYKQVVTSGAPTTREYYDAFGRVLKTQKTGFDGNYVSNSYVYNEKGQLTEASLPWKQGDIPLKQVFLYDVYGRKIQENSDAGTVNYSYLGKTIQITSSGGQTSSQTMDSQGNILTSTDNGGTVSNTYKSIGKPSSIANNGSTWSMVYDTYGRQTSLSDPNAGTIAYRYNKFGELTRQLDAKGNIDSLTYDALGRVLTEVRIKGATLEGTKTYKYDPSGKPGLLDSVSYSGGSEKYNYDSNGRLTSDVIRIDGSGYSTSYGYDIYSRIQTITYPSTFAIKHVYTNGYLDEVRRNDNNALIWDATSMNVFGQYTQYNSGNTLTTIKTYDCLGMLRGIVTDTIQNLGYSFNAATGNIISRTNNRRNLTEIFNYDNLGRLTGVSGPSTLSTSYANNGNITNKTSVGDYTYGTMPHAVTGVTNPDGLISTSDQRLSYTSYNKTDSIIQSNYIYTLKYGHQDQRILSKLFSNGTLQKTVYYAGNFEKEVIAGIPYPKNIHYIYGGDGLAAIYTTQSSNSDMYYVHKDHLGSIDKITNSSKIVIQKNSFDAWGKRRNPDNWTYSNIPSTIFSRGYTGHEHLDLFDLINMNGRMYDPILGRFLSSDKFVQNSSGSQSYNRYSYGLNNPLLYTDPSGWKAALMDEYWNLGIEITNQTDFSFGNHYGGSRRSGGFAGIRGKELGPTLYQILMALDEGVYLNVGGGEFVRVDDGNEMGPATGGGDDPPQLYGTNRSTRIPDGELTTFSAGFAFLGGMSVEYGTVTDRQGGKIRVKIINGNIGFGLSAGYSSKEIYVTPNDPDGVFTVDEFLNSYTHEIEGGIFVFDISKGWQANPDLTTPSTPYFLIQGGGLTFGLNFNIWWTRSSKTSQW